ncbi:HlyD family secretion protein [Pseudomonas aeruginosa]|nr:HlyD family secretion protein [Pseudomonas aeruginosa]
MNFSQPAGEVGRHAAGDPRRPGEGCRRQGHRRAPGPGRRQRVPAGRRAAVLRPGGRPRHRHHRHACLFRNPHRESLPGGYVQVRLQRAVNPQAITVPRDALIRTAQSAVVKVVNPQGVVEDVEVRADTLQGRDWIISRGLKGGERVIVENAAQHAAGSSVQAVVRQPASADALTAGRLAGGPVTENATNGSFLH